MRKRITIPLFGRKLHFLLRTTKKRTEFHFGIGNRTKDGKFLIFLDYDNTPLEWVRQEIGLIQDVTQAGTAYLFKTKNGIHVVFLEKFFFMDLIRILDMTSTDKRYSRVPMKYANNIWILRNSNKKNETIKYLGYKFKESPMEISRAHRDYLVQYLRVPKAHTEQSPQAIDDSDDVVLGYYTISKENN